MLNLINLNKLQENVDERKNRYFEVLEATGQFQFRKIETVRLPFLALGMTQIDRKLKLSGYPFGSQNDRNRLGIETVRLPFLAIRMTQMGWKLKLSGYPFWLSE